MWDAHAPDEPFLKFVLKKVWGFNEPIHKMEHTVIFTILSKEEWNWDYNEVWKQPKNTL